MSEQLMTIETGDGQQFAVDFEEITQGRKERARVVTFAEYSGDRVQRRSSGGLSTSLTIWFSGERYADEALRFETATEDVRPLWFQHPLRPSRQRMQLLGWKRRDDLVRKVGEIAYTLSLHEHLSESTLSAGSVTPVAEMAVAVDTLREAVVRDFAAAVMNSVPVEAGRVSVLARIKQKLSGFLEKLAGKIESLSGGRIVELQQKVAGAMAMVKSIEEDVRAVAYVLTSVVETAINTVKSVKKFIRDYVELCRELFGDSIDSSRSSGVDDPAVFAVIAPMILGVWAAGLVAVDSDDFSSRREVHEVAAELRGARDDLYGLVDEWGDSWRVDPVVVQSVTGIVNGVLVSLNETALGAKRERYEILKRDREPYGLVYELYAPFTPEEFELRFDQFCRANDIRGNERFLLKAGREVVYCV